MITFYDSSEREIFATSSSFLNLVRLVSKSIGDSRLFFHAVKVFKLFSYRLIRNSLLHYKKMYNNRLVVLRNSSRKSNDLREE